MAEKLENLAKDYFEKYPEIEYPGLDEDPNYLFIRLLILMDDEKQFKRYTKKGYSMMTVYSERPGEDTYTGLKNETELNKFKELLKQTQIENYRIYSSLDDFNI